MRHRPDLRVDIPYPSPRFQSIVATSSPSPGSQQEQFSQSSNSTHASYTSSDGHRAANGAGGYWDPTGRVKNVPKDSPKRSRDSPHGPYVGDDETDDHRTHAAKRRLLDNPISGSTQVDANTRRYLDTTRSAVVRNRTNDHSDRPSVPAASDYFSSPYAPLHDPVMAGPPGPIVGPVAGPVSGPPMPNAQTGRRVVGRGFGYTTEERLRLLAAATSAVSVKTFEGVLPGRSARQAYDTWVKTVAPSLRNFIQSGVRPGSN